jgi:ribose-phosphate pyrophosphokinase
MLVVALPGGETVAAALAHELQCPSTALAVHRFPDGETLVRFDVPLAGECVVLAGSLHQPDAKTLPLVFAAEAARELDAARIGLVAPYLAYMRQDARFRPGEAVTSRSYARLLSAALDFLVTADPHLHRWRTLTDIYAIPTQAVASAPAIAWWLRTQVQDALLVGPDSESAQWVAEVARLAQVPWTVMHKTRRGDRDVRVALRPDAAWRNRNAVLLDDIVSTGHTLCAAAGALRDAGLPPRLAIAVHALFEDGAVERLNAAGIPRIVSCDTVPHATNAIPLGPLLAQATLALAHDQAR